MSDGTLSQEEIDALLSGGSAAPPSGSAAEISTTDSDSLSVFRNVLEGTVDDVSTRLRGSVGDDFQLRLTAASEVGHASQVPLTGNSVCIQADINNGGMHPHFYAISESDALKILMAITGMKDIQLDESMLNELRGSFEQVSKVLTAALSFQLGAVNIGHIQVLQRSSDQLIQDGTKFAMVSYQFETNPMDSGTLYEFFDYSLVERVGSPDEGGDLSGGVGLGLGSSRAGAGMGIGGTQTPQANTTIQSVQFPQLNTASQSADQGNLGLLMDVSMELTVELGRARKLIQEILGMGEGTIIELDKLAGEPVDILVNHKLIAKGEVVVIDENFGVRVTEILSPFEHIKNY